MINISELFKFHYCVQLIDASIISISTHCTGLQSLNLGRCHQITDASIPSILNLECCCADISDASFIVIAMDLVVTSYVVMNSSLRAVFLSITGVPAPEQQDDDGPNLLSEEALKKESDRLCRKNQIFKKVTVFLIYPNWNMLSEDKDTL